MNLISLLTRDSKIMKKKFIFKSIFPSPIQFQVTKMLEIQFQIKSLYNRKISKDVKIAS